MNGVALPQAVMMCIPEPWANDRRIDRKKRDFYHYYATMMEPWDGPAAIVFSDGDQVGAVLDRNGLRPCRWYVTDDDYLILSSEVGVLDIEPAKIVKKSRLRPGRMLLVDTVAGKLVEDRDLKEKYASQQPYGEWLDANLVYLKDLSVPNRRVEKYPQELRDRLYKAFGYTYEEVKDSILPMARTGAEPAAAMGADIPLAALDQVHQPLFSYFRQLFAQVTNPPIDAIREEIVTDTTVYVGTGGNLLREEPANCAMLQLPSPILTSVELMKIRYMDRPHFKVETLSLLYYKGSPLENAVEQLFIAADRAYRKGANILILSDRGVDENHMAIPSLLAVSALQKHLVRTKKRTAVSLILESGEPRDVHHFAALLGYGATAINPYLAQDCVEELISIGLLDKDPGVAVEDYNSAVLHGVVKIASKMGVSTIQSYAIGADKGYVYVRAEYPVAVKHLGIAIRQAKERGLLGENIFGTGFNFDLEIKLGAGAFVCGEETALMTSIEGKRGEPHPRPPFPAVKGLFESPTILNNVETYANICPIILNGAEWFAAIGSEKSKGTKVFALGGKIRNTGLVEVPMGTTLREIVEEIGGGIPKGKKFKAAQTGGPSGGCIPASLIDTPIDYDNLISIGTMMGSGGLIVMDEDTCMVDIAKFFLEFTVDESCGKCTPCRVGTKRLLELLNKITEGRGTMEDLERIEELAAFIKENSLCGLGQTAPNPVLSTLRYFRDEYVEHIVNKRCPAGVCRALLTYQIDPAKCRGCTACARACPAGAIIGSVKNPHKIDTEKCIKCGGCMEKCRFDAISRS